MALSEENPPSKGEKKSKGSYTTGMSVASAMKAVKDLGLTDRGEIFRFMKKHSPVAFSVLNTDPKKWVQLQKNANYKPPILEEEIKAYQDYQSKTDDLKRRSDASELRSYLTGNKFTPFSKSDRAQSGQSILDRAKEGGTKIIKNDDGTYTMFDDQTTFRDTDKDYGKGRIIHPQAKYNRQTYKRGNDLVSVYDFAEAPAHSGRIPTDEEMRAYGEGNLNMIALDPQYKPYYATAFLDPSKQEGNDRTLFYGANTNAEDIDRFNEFKQMQELLKPAYERRAKLRKIMDKMIPDNEEGWENTLGRAGDALQIPLGLAGGVGGFIGGGLNLESRISNPLLGALASAGIGTIGGIIGGSSPQLFRGIGRGMDRLNGKRK